MTDQEHPLIRGLRWILATRKLSQRALSLKAGRSHSHVGQILSGRVDPTSVQLDVIEDIARAGDIPVEWLLTGKGLPETEVDADDFYAPTPERDLYDSRPAAISVLRSAGLDEDLLQAVAKRRLDSPMDPGMQFWIDMGLELKRETQRVRAALKAIEDDDPDRATAFEPKPIEHVVKPRKKR